MLSGVPYVALTLAAALAFAASAAEQNGETDAIASGESGEAVGALSASGVSLEASDSGVSESASFLLSRERLFGEDQEILFPGFIFGLRGFEHFYEPIGQPLYFESPFNNTSLRLLYLHHRFPSDGTLRGGDLNVFAAQARLAITERLGLIATKDGYSLLDADALPEDEGWNDIAIGLKYALLVDRESDFVLTPGVRWQWSNGDREVLQGDCQEISPFVSVAKGFERFHILGNLTYRVPTDSDDGNQVFSWDAHFDYEIAPESLPGFAPVVEVHGLHYMSDGERLPLDVGGMDYTNLGSTDVQGSAVVWVGMGFRWKLTPALSLGTTFELPLTDEDEDIMDSRVTVDFIITF